MHLPPKLLILHMFQLWLRRVIIAVDIRKVILTTRTAIIITYNAAAAIIVDFQPRKFHLMICFHTDGKLSDDNSIFVFGSNLAGVHGAGAAAAALGLGAEWGTGAGPQGKTYAIPTKDVDIKTMSLDKIRPYIEEFVQFTKDHPEMNFFVTRVGCGLAGYSDGQIAPLFKGAINCSFAQEWQQHIER